MNTADVNASQRSEMDPRLGISKLKVEKPSTIFNVVASKHDLHWCRQYVRSHTKSILRHARPWMGIRDPQRTFAISRPRISSAFTHARVARRPNFSRSVIHRSAATLSFRRRRRRRRCRRRRHRCCDEETTTKSDQRRKAKRRSPSRQRLQDEPTVSMQVFVVL